MGNLRQRNSKQKHRKIDEGMQPKSVLMNFAYLPIFLVIFYLVGYSFSIGYFDYFGIDADHFSRSYEGYATKTLIGYLGVLGIVNPDKLNFFMLMNILFTVLASVLLYSLLRLLKKSTSSVSNKTVNTIRQINKSNGDFLGDMKITLALVPLWLSPTLIFIASVFVVMYVFFLPYSAGIEVAKEFAERAKLIDCQQSKESLDKKLSEQQKLCSKVHDSENEEVGSGFEIAASENKIAIYNAGKISILWLKEGYKIERSSRN
jgi:hypothetical protein